jgi:carboxypeptidase T
MADFHRNSAAGAVMTSVGVNMTFRSLQADLAALRAAAPAGLVDGVQIEIGRSEQNAPIHVIRIGRNPDKPVLITGCHHAREWISVEVPYLFAEYLLDQYATDPRVRRLVDDRDIWIVPLLNPDGHEHSVLTDRLWRKNSPTAGGRESVDLNRNYDTARWGTTTGMFSDDPASHAYRGQSPAYAREVQALQTLITTHRFLGVLDYHAYGRFVLFPYQGRAEAHPDPLQSRMAANLERIVDARGTNYTCMAGSALYPLLHGVAPVDGVVPGGLLDFVVEHVPEAIAITVELEPDWGNAWAFELPDTEIEPTFVLHRGAMLSFLNCIGNLRYPPASRRMLLEPGASNDLVVTRADCSATFQGY